MIKYNNSNINDWYFYTSDIIKVYRNNAVCYYKLTGGGDVPTAQTPCFAVVNDISQYSDTEFEDVFNKADGKWYKLNNLNQYEEYGVYGSGRTITYYEGKLTIDGDYEYIYSGSSWVNVGEVSGGTATLPDVPFTVNYNAKNYDANTKTLFKTSGQLADVDAVLSKVPTVNDGYLTISNGTKATISGYQTYFNRDNNNPNLTIISKQKTSGSSCHMFANRGSTYNWMYRPYDTKLTLHGSSQQGSVAVTTQPVIESVRVNSNRLATYNNYTDNTSSTYSSFSYGSANSTGVALFAGYYGSGNEYFVGDFYWVYMSQNTLTDEQVQQVINYNEGGGGEPEYPMYYDEMQDPPNNLTFSSMTEAESYECPWVGMKATIDGDNYVFSGDSQSGYEWVYQALPYDAEIEYLGSNGTQYINTNAYITNTSNFEVGYELVGSASENQWGWAHQNVGNGAWVGVSNIYAFFGRYGSSYWVNIQSSLSSVENKIVYKSNSGVTVNGTFYSKTLNLSTTDNITTIPLYIFAWYDFYSSGLQYSSSTNFKSFYLKVNDTLVLDMIPVRVGQVGYMYDRVSEQLFGNDGTDNFILGADK